MQSFGTTGTEDIFNGINTQQARQTCPQTLWRIAQRKLDQLDSVDTLIALRSPPGNHMEALSGDRQGLHSLRINRQYRICFVWTPEGLDGVEIVDYHA
ncbi:type II toxin-antitoxin system RelE/ParE family toxin [Candidatus Entotheonella palauensis]|uniref:type II toxin-antitoxin system RelE/ParE family toxin n=1 Tax=Candidatus Entotheonella palauensis TaxID=93172 RepID=UPI000B7D7188|nr:type II toxin-antitoxin system RelE/ParE family toxin [Candidatus Entotheonella palauensis]